MQKFLAFFFRQLYHRFSWAYDLVAGFVSLGQWNNWIYEILPRISGTKILELGIGPGYMQAALQDHHHAAFGLDESHEMARQTARRLSRAKTGQGLRIVRARAEAVPFPTGCFETVVATFPTPYIFSPETASEIARVLVPGGRLVILLAARPVGRSLPNLFTQWLFKITGESPPDDYALSKVTDPFTKVGLQSNVTWQKGKDCLLLIITALKP